MLCSCLAHITNMFAILHSANTVSGFSKFAGRMSDILILLVKNFGYSEFEVTRDTD
jgi:hypothetical protein